MTNVETKTENQTSANQKPVRQYRVGNAIISVFQSENGDLNFVPSRFYSKKDEDGYGHAKGFYIRHLLELAQVAEAAHRREGGLIVKSD